MTHIRCLLIRVLVMGMICFMAMASAFAQEVRGFTDDPNRNVRTVLLLTSYPVADIVTNEFFDSFRRGIRELNLPVDCHVVELNASVKGARDLMDNTFERLIPRLNEGLYSAIVTVNYDAANVVMRHYEEFPRSVPVIFTSLGRVPENLKRDYPNSTAISIADDTPGTVDLGLKLFPEAQNLVFVADDTSLSEKTMNEIMDKCKLLYPKLDYTWLPAMTDKREIQRRLDKLSPETLILFFPSHDYANGHNETLNAYVRNVGFDTRFPCLALDDSLLGNGVVGGCLIETSKTGHEAARMVAQVLNAGSAQRIAEREITPVRIVDYTKFRSYDKTFSGRIPLGVRVINKPETIWTRHWQAILVAILVIILITALQILSFNWIRRRLRLNRSMLYSLPGSVMVLNRAETILFASWIKESALGRDRRQKKLEQLPGIDYPKLSQIVHDVFQTGRQTIIEYNYEDNHRAISFAPLAHGIFGQDAVICFSLDNTELQNARKEAEKYAAELKKNTRMWDILINFLPIHIYAKDIDDEFRYVFNNRTRCRFYGVGENELNGKTDFDFLPAEFAARMRREDEELVANPDILQQERSVDMQSRDGRVHHLRSIQRLFTDADGTRLLLGTSMDITELEEVRIQMQQLNAKLQELLEQHSVLLDNMPSFVVTKDIDNDFRIISCNDACLKFVNLPPESVIGKTDFDILQFREDAEAMHAADLHAVQVLQNRPEYHSTGRFHDTKGRVRIGKFYRKLIHTSDNRQVLFILFSDVTDLENAKREAEENADRFLLTLRSIGDGVITTDHEGVVTLLNPNAEKMLDCKQAQALGKPHSEFFRIVRMEDGLPAPSPLKEALGTGRVVEGEDQTVLISAKGVRYIISSSAAPIRTRSGEIAGAILVFRDVTEEYNKREELRRTMTDLETASDMARLASFHFEIESRKRTGSNLIREIWPEDENGEALVEEKWVHPDDLPLFKRTMAELIAKNRPNEAVQFSFRVVPAPDDIRYYRMNVMLDLSNPGAARVTGIIQDVTELTLSMLKLKDAQALWDAAINAIPIMFTVKDADDDYRYLLCNNAFSQVFDLSSDEIIGKTDQEIFHDDQILGFADIINQPTIGTNGGTREIEGELRIGNGQRRFIRTVLRTLEDASGRRLLLAASSDVTDMRHLIMNQKAVNGILESILSENDFDDCIARTITDVCELLGASRACLLQHQDDGTRAHCIAEYVAPGHDSIKFLGKTRNRVRNVLDRTEDNRTFVCNDARSIDWSRINAEDWERAAKAIDLRAIFLSNIVFNGEIWGTMGFNFEGVDHTFTADDETLLRSTVHMIELILARKQARDLIMDALERAQAADKAKSFFIASVSHEIRTPLNSVIGFAELLREGGVSPTQQNEYLDAIASSANALLMLINDVLDLSKLEANQMQIITAFTDFKALCREVMLIFTFRAQENGNKLVSNVPEDLPELDVDNIRIRQILINLLGNAVKFTKKGTITLTVKFTPDADGDTGSLYFGVSDTGIGISEEDQKKLMEPFVQLSKLRGTNAVNNGTGLGLSISKRLAVCMNGSLNCTSAVGEGSTFYVTLNAVRYREPAQVAEAAPAEPAAKAKPERDISKLRIMVVDDVPMNLRVVKAIFNKIGVKNVVTMGSGREALHYLEKDLVDIILSDMWMPEMNGAEFSAAVKKIPRLRHIPIVAQTADVETRGNFDMSNFDAILLKPMTKEKLTNMIERVLGLGDHDKPGDEEGGLIDLG